MQRMPPKHKPRVRRGARVMDIGSVVVRSTQVFLVPFRFRTKELGRAEILRLLSAATLGGGEKGGGDRG